MALKDVLKGIQIGIDLFQPMAEQLKLALDAEQRKPRPDPQMRNTARVSFRCFAEVVGGLKLKRDEHAGLKDQPRHETHARYVELRRRAAEEWDNPATRNSSEETERQADACIAVFALSADGKLPRDAASGESTLPADPGLVN